MQQIHAQKTKITAATFQSKFRSKKELYVFLTVDVKAYLCNCDNLTVYYLKDLVSGKRKL